MDRLLVVEKQSVNIWELLFEMRFSILLHRSEIDIRISRLPNIDSLILVLFRCIFAGVFFIRSSYNRCTRKANGKECEMSVLVYADINTVWIAVFDFDF